MKGNTQEIQVYLECPLQKPFSQINLLPDYRIERYRNGLENEWTRVQNLVFGPEKIRVFEKVFPMDVDKKGVFFAFFHNQVVGIAAARMKATNQGNIFCFLDWVGVQKEHQGKHLGLALSVAALNYLKDLGVCSFVSVRTPGYRKPAILLYQKLGFGINFIGEKVSVIERQEMRANGLSGK